MKHRYLLTLIVTLFFSYSNAQDKLWRKVSQRAMNPNTTMERSSLPKDYKILNLDLEQLKKILKEAPLEKGNEKSNIVVPFPTLSGEIENFEVYVAPIMAKELSNKFPTIQSYIGKSIDNPSSIIRFSITAFGLHLINFSTDNGAIYIDPYTTDLENYIVYNKSDLEEKTRPICETDKLESNILNKKFTNTTHQTQNNNNFFREYRLALSCTPEYANFHINRAIISQIPASTDEEKKAVILSAMTASITRVNSIFERDLGIRLNLIANNENLINLVHDTNFNRNTDSNAMDLLSINQRLTDNIIGNSNYDIGHIFSTGGGGVAALGSICNQAYKAQGVTGSHAPVGDPFDVDFVAHEMGHQLGAEHTFNMGCVDAQISYSTSFEPGSGTTIMAYAGVCSDDANTNIQFRSNPYFHIVSIVQISNNLSRNTCSTNTQFSDAAPVVNAGADKTIPKSTPFKLTGSATDIANEETLTYSWEQLNREHTQQPPLPSHKEGPMFRVYDPTTSPTRYFPKFENVLSESTYRWEVLPSVTRTLDFALTARNNNITEGGQTGLDFVKITIADSGPFVITYPNTTAVEWEGNSTQTITWDVAGTTANGINTSLVNISISTDNGQTFTPLLENTPNDGSEDITVPNIDSNDARILIEPVDNVYYAVSKKFKITETNISIEKFGLKNFNLYPNPTHDAFTINFESNTNNNINISILDLRGRLVLNKTYKNNGYFNQQIRLNNVESGMYLISIEDGDNKEFKKVIKL